MRLIFAAFCGLVATWVHAPLAWAEKVGDTPGFAATKPAEGPSVEVDGGFLVPYTLTIPGTAVEIPMVPVPGGQFKLGSSESDTDHAEDEVPQIQVSVGPMWVAKKETSWAEYKLYMSMYKLLKSLQSEGLRKIDESNRVDAVTAPTELYDASFTFEHGEDPELPAVTMTQYAAKQYTKWLSKLTGQQYRLPTEAEWEYACRAGSDSAYSFGDTASGLDEFAWYAENSEGTPHPVGTKKPNAFGLHDMHGNVMEWTINGHTEDGYQWLSGKQQPVAFEETIFWSESFDKRVVRGGSWQDDAEQLRSAARLASEDEDWKDEDPNFPLSPWWYTDDPARGVGFRIFRSYIPIDAELVKKFWDIDNEDIQMDVDMRLTEGRGVLSPINPALADDIKKSNP